MQILYQCQSAKWSFCLCKLDMEKVMVCFASQKLIHWLKKS